MNNRRNEECFNVCQLKVQLDSYKHIMYIINIINIKHISHIIGHTFVMMLKSFLASSRDAVPCVR